MLDIEAKKRVAEYESEEVLPTHQQGLYFLGLAEGAAELSDDYVSALEGVVPAKVAANPRELALWISRHLIPKKDLPLIRASIESSIAQEESAGRRVMAEDEERNGQSARSQEKAERLKGILSVLKKEPHT